MSIHIYNSLTKKKEEFIPLDPAGKKINMYTCGVTVYDDCHIGHARSLYVFDVIRRYLTHLGYSVNFVRNITDVDDKIIKKAVELKKSADEVARANITGYYRDMESLGVEKANVAEPKATDNIADMVKDIQGLIDGGYAYEAQGDVYFSVRKFSKYGKLSGQSVEKMLEAVRIEKDSKKKDPLDFALWKKSKENEPSWDYFGGGRPGWHIECSCMSLKYLKCQTLDIHAGGRDLIFPHHENEIAQAEALSQKSFAKYWLHHGLLTINGQKMAKSLGNFITIQDALKKYSADTLKLFFLFSHYASDTDFTDKKMNEAAKALDRFDILFWKAYELIKEQDIVPIQAEFIQVHKQAFIEAMNDDFNTPKALGALFDLISATNKFIDEEKSNSHYLGVVYHAVDTIESFGRGIFGLFTKEVTKELTPELQSLLDERKKSRFEKNFKRSDELRDTLKRNGVAVEDTKDGQTWRWI